MKNETWSARQCIDGTYQVFDKHFGFVIAGMIRCRGDALRIASALNAVEFIPTEALEAGVVSDMSEALEDIHNDTCKIGGKITPGDYYLFQDRAGEVLVKLGIKE